MNFVKFLRTIFLQNSSGGCFCWTHRDKRLIAWNVFPERIGDTIIVTKLKGINVNKIKNANDNSFGILKSLKVKLKHHFTKESSLELYSSLKN